MDLREAFNKLNELNESDFDGIGIFADGQDEVDITPEMAAKAKSMLNGVESFLKISEDKLEGLGTSPEEVMALLRSDVESELRGEGGADGMDAVDMLLHNAPHQVVIMLIDDLSSDDLDEGMECSYTCRLANRLHKKEGELEEDLKGYVKNHYLDMFMDKDAKKGAENGQPANMPGEEMPGAEMPGEPGQPMADPRGRKAKKTPEDAAYEKALAVAKLDPTFKGREDAKPEDALKKDKGAYFEWLIRMLKKGTVTFEQMMEHGDEFTDQLVHFDAAKKRKKLPDDKKDIMRIKDLSELSELINSLGADIDASDVDSSTFKGVVSNIRGALQAICGFKDEEIPAEIQKTEDALTLIAETDKWELWRINSIWGAMLADTYGFTWGGGATWCTGGQYGNPSKEPRQGSSLLDSASRFYGNYTGNGTFLHFFQQKDNTVARPKNKAQFQLTNNYNVANFFHANDSSIGLTDDGKISWSGGRYGVNTAEVMTVFIQQEGLLDALKNSEVKGMEPIADAENLARLERGEPYEYVGGKIKDSFKSAIKTLVFEADGKKHEVNVKEHPDYLKCTSVEDMANMERLIAGQPYIYNGDKVKDVFKTAIKEVVFSEDYDKKVPTKDDTTKKTVNVIGVERGAFAGCTNLEKVTLPASLVMLGMGAFSGCDKAKIYTPRYPDRPFRFWPSEMEYFKEHLYYDDGEKVIGGSKKSK